MKALPGFALSALISAALAGCVENNDCTLIAAYGLTVRVRDSTTGVPAGNGAIVTAYDGPYSETLHPNPSDSLTFVGAIERPGVYTIQVAKVGYAHWSQSGVEVSAGSCHIQGAEVEVPLQVLGL